MRIGIIHRGRLIEELDAEKVEVMRLRRLEVKSRNMEGARRALLQAGFAVQADEDSLILTEAGAVDAPDKIAALLVQAGVSPTHLAVEQEDLESHFLRLTEERT
jgi:ABC-2 type transport system ATP-binding protein